jgi:DNA-binding CsgD family transcriptional regulator
MRTSIDLGGPELVSLNSRVGFDEASSVESLEIIADDALTPEDIVVDMEAAQAARDEINAFGFTDEESRALFLWIDELLSLNQIGEIMEGSKNTVKARLTAAAEKMSLTYGDLEARRELLKGAS